MNNFKTNEQETKGNLDESPFALILDSKILTSDVVGQLVPLKEELKETFLKSQVFRTRTEMEVSILNEINHPTPASKYWQSVREQNVMFTELVMLSYEYRKNIVEIKKLVRKLEKETDDLEKELTQIEIDKLNFILRNQEKTAKDRIREIVAWSEIKERVAKNMTEAELKDVDNHQLISYTQRWIKQSMVMGKNGSPAERRNLLGQLRSGILSCYDKGILNKVLVDFPIEVGEKIYQEYGFKK